MRSQDGTDAWATAAVASVRRHRAECPGAIVTGAG